MSKKCNCGINGREKSDKYVKLTKEVETNSDIIGNEAVENLKNFRRKYPDGDLSVYKIEVKENE